MRISIDDINNKDELNNNNTKENKATINSDAANKQDNVGKATINTEDSEGYTEDSLELAGMSFWARNKYRDTQFRNRLKNMQGKQKVKYFFQYYKFTFIGLGVALVICLIAGNMIYKALLPEVLQIAIVNQEYDSDAVNEYIINSFREYYDLDNKNYFSVYKELSVSANEDPEAMGLQMTSYQTIGYYNVHNMVDIIICDSEALETFKWSDDTTAIDLAMDKELYSKVESHVVMLKDDNKIKNNGVEYAGALDITDTEFVKGAGIQYSPVYLLIPSSKYQDNEATLNFIKMVYKL